MTINATAPILFSMYAAIAEEQGAKADEIRGTVQNDILKEYLARNTFIYPPAQSMRLAIDLVEYSIERYPKWHPISISGYHIREAGATAAQELAFTFADAIAYVDAAKERGLSQGSSQIACSDSEQLCFITEPFPPYLKRISHYTTTAAYFGY
jgi:methylmalonyl-CoA mutase N-terminal domain/subunit